MQNFIFALGFFDGVHLGHQALLKACREMAEKMDCIPAAVTFDRHPASLTGGNGAALLNSTLDREKLLRRYGAAYILELPFDEELRHTPWQAFIRKLQGLGGVGFVCGADFRFGYQGEGDASKLCAFAPCTVVPEQYLEGVRISSTAIRSMVAQGKMEAAVRFLGHPQILSGTVIPGRQLGRTIGIPTANLALPEGVLVPKFGVYACKAVTPQGTYLAVTNIGTRPTVEGHRVTVEPWLLDFQGDLYGQTLELELYSFLRPEQKFENLAALQGEIQKNAAQTRKFFEK